MAITPASKHPDEAFKVIQVVTSDEVQAEAARNGRISVLQDPKYQTEYGKNMDYLKDKNVQAIFKAVPAKPFDPTSYDNQAQPVMTKAMNEVAKGKDVNTALRDADIQINKIVKDLKGK
jgi:multiple sugar transport system substrate-binding protein